MTRCVLALNSRLNSRFLGWCSVKSYGTVLGTHIRPLPVKRTGIVRNKKGSDERIERNYLRVVINLDGFGMPRLSAADLLIGWVVEFTTGIARNHLPNPAQGLELASVHQKQPPANVATASPGCRVGSVAGGYRQKPLLIWMSF